MNGNLMDIQDAHGKRVQLTQNRIIYGEEVVDVDDVIAIMTQEDSTPGTGNLVKVLVSRRGGERPLVIEDLIEVDANQLIKMFDEIMPGRR